MVPSHDRGENQVALRVSGMSMGKEMLMPRDKLVDALPSDQADGKRGRLLALKRERRLPETTWQLHKQQTHKKQCGVLQ